MFFRRAAAFLPVLFVACSFPDYQFDDKRFNAQQGLGGDGGTDASGGKGGTSGKGGSGANGGGAGSGGDAGNGEGGDAGTGGSGGNPVGGSGGASGSASGAGGSDAGTGGGSGTGGMAGASAGTGGSGGTTGGAGAGTAGSSGKGGSGPAGTCKTASDCKASESCSEPTKIGTEQYFKCFVKNPDAGTSKPGGVCDDGGDCDSFICLMTTGSTKGVCSGTCGTDADCAPGGVCFEDQLSQNSSLRLCSPGCVSDAGCDPGLQMSCALYEDTLSEKVAFACQRTGGVGFGLEPPAGQGCNSNVVIDKKCTKPCESNAECGPPFPACKSGPIGTASGGTAVIKVCTTQ